MWEGGALTVALIPSGARGEALLGLAREWTEQGLLSSALWVRPEAVALGEPPRVSAIVMASVEGVLMEREVDLFEILARESLKLVRLIKVRSALPDRDLDELQDEIGDVVSRWVGYSMPLLNPRLSGSPDRIELVRASLICAPTRHQMGDRVAWA